MFCSEVRIDGIMIGVLNPTRAIAPLVTWPPFMLPLPIGASLKRGGAGLKALGATRGKSDLAERLIGKSAPGNGRHDYNGIPNAKRGIATGLRYA